MGRPLEEREVMFDIERIDRRILHLKAFYLGGACNIGSSWTLDLCFQYERWRYPDRTDRFINLVIPNYPTAY